MAIHTIGEICNINALSIKKGEYPKRILYLDTANLVEGRVCKMQEMNFTDAPSRAQRRIKNNTILYSSVRPNLKHFGIMTNMPSNVIVSTGFITIDVIDNNCFSPHYIYYLLTQQNIINYLQGIAQNGVSAYPSINPFDIANLKFNFPSLSEQEHIASVLSNIDKKIALNRQINDNLEAMAKQLYDYWFVQFDFPDENGKPYKSSGGAMVWNEKLKREIPQGWSVSNVKSLIEPIERGISYSSDDLLNPFATPMINLACFSKAGEYRLGEMKFFSGKVSNDKLISPMDMLIACTDMTQGADIIGRPILASDEYDQYTFSTDLGPKGDCPWQADAAA